MQGSNQATIKDVLQSATPDIATTKAGNTAKEGRSPEETGTNHGEMRKKTGSN
jgi:hypothetical protein